MRKRPFKHLRKSLKNRGKSGKITGDPAKRNRETSINQKKSCNNLKIYVKFVSPDIDSNVTCALAKAMRSLSLLAPTNLSVAVGFLLAVRETLGFWNSRTEGRRLETPVLETAITPNQARKCPALSTSQSTSFRKQRYFPIAPDVRNVFEPTLPVLLVRNVLELTGEEGGEGKKSLRSVSPSSSSSSARSLRGK